MNATLRFDGGCRPTNPGHAACAWVIRAPNGDLITHGAKLIGFETNNFAEYSGLVAGLGAALAAGVKRLLVISDSKLVISQMSQGWKVKHPKLRDLWEQAKELAERFEQIVFSWQRRSHNQEADKLCSDLLVKHVDAARAWEASKRMPEEFMVGDGTQMSLRREEWFGGA